jgi:hypothetical protein
MAVTGSKLHPIIFKWSPFPGAVGYRLVVGLDPTFNKKISDTKVKTPEAVLNLEPVKRYYWYVEVDPLIKTAGPSEIRAFGIGVSGFAPKIERKPKPITNKVKVKKLKAPKKSLWKLGLAWQPGLYRYSAESDSSLELDITVLQSIAFNFELDTFAPWSYALEYYQGFKELPKVATDNDAGLADGSQTTVSPREINLQVGYGFPFKLVLPMTASPKFGLSMRTYPAIITVDDEEAGESVLVKNKSFLATDLGLALDVKFLTSVDIKSQFTFSLPFLDKIAEPADPSGSQVENRPGIGLQVGAVYKMWESFYLSTGYKFRLIRYTVKESNRSTAIDNTQHFVWFSGSYVY